MADKPWVEPIRRLRTQQDLTQGELAEKAGLRGNTLSEALNGRSPRVDTLEKIATALDVPLWALFTSQAQYDLLTQHAQAEQNLRREQDIAARVEARVLNRLSSLIKDATTEELQAPTAAEVPQPKRKRA